MKLDIKKVLAFAAVIMGFFMALLDTTIVNIALPKMTAYFDTTMQHMTWVINAYNLVFAVFIITASRLADQFGRKKLFLIGVFFFTLTSFLSGVSTSADMLIISRALQGLAGAIILPVSVPIALSLVSKEKQSTVLGVWAAISGLAAASGPTLSGFLTEKFNWQSIFFVNVPIGIISLALIAYSIKESYDATASRKIDFSGMTALSVSMFALVYALIQANDKGWTSMYILSLFVLCIASLIAFVIIEVKSKEPMLPMWLMKIGQFNASSLTLLVLGAGIMCTSLMMSFFMTRTMGLTELQAGMTLSIMPLSSAAFAAATGVLTKKIGSKWFIIVGMSCIALSAFLFSGLTNTSSRFDVIWRLIITGAGMGFSLAPSMEAAISNVPEEKVGITSGVINMTRSLGAVLGVAIIVTILNANVTTEITKAKDQIKEVIKTDSVFDVKAKDEFIKTIDSIKISQDSEIPKIDKIESILNEKEKEALSKIPADKSAAVKAVFKMQKDEVEKIWPTEILPAINNSMVASFSKTFKYGSIMLLLGLVCAVFCGTIKPKRKINKNKNMVTDL